MRIQTILNRVEKFKSFVFQMAGLLVLAGRPGTGGSVCESAPPFCLQFKKRPSDLNDPRQRLFDLVLGRCRTQADAD